MTPRLVPADADPEMITMTSTLPRHAVPTRTESPVVETILRPTTVHLVLVVPALPRIDTQTVIEDIDPMDEMLRDEEETKIATTIATTTADTVQVVEIVVVMTAICQTG